MGGLSGILWRHLLECLLRSLLGCLLDNMLVYTWPLSNSQRREEMGQSINWILVLVAFLLRSPLAQIFSVTSFAKSKSLWFSNSLFHKL